MELPTNADKYNENQTIYEYITEQATGVQSFVFFCRLLAVDIRIFKVYIKKKNKYRASLLAQWIRTYLLMQETRVQSLVQEDSTCRGVTKLMGHNF